MENQRLQKYENDPTIGPLVAQYQLSCAALNRLKGDLRNTRNINQIIQVSEHQVAVRQRLRQLIGVREQKIRRHQLHHATVAIGFLLLVVGIANLGLLLGWWQI